MHRIIPWINSDQISYLPFEFDKILLQNSKISDRIFTEYFWLKCQIIFFLCGIQLPSRLPVVDPLVLLSQKLDTMLVIVNSCESWNMLMLFMCDLNYWKYLQLWPFLIFFICSFICIFAFIGFTSLTMFFLISWRNLRVFVWI